MSHYAGHGFLQEPFSTSPDPNFLLATRQHATCLQELEISLRLRRGLNVVTGDIGTGKTTLCRSLLRTFAADKSTDLHLMLDPHFETSEEFLRVILSSVSGVTPEPGLGLWGLKEVLKQQLFRLGMVEKRLVILVIDEGQKISRQNLEILREMLNYETNTAKLLQIVLFGQRELEPMLEAMPNLADRINVRRRLTPLSFTETRRMIRHRLVVASGGAEPALSFTLPAVVAIHSAAKGSPRKAVRLCHMAMLEMLVRGGRQVGLSEARAAIRPEGAPRNTRAKVALAAAVGLCLVFGGLFAGLRLQQPETAAVVPAEGGIMERHVAQPPAAPAQQAEPAATAVHAAAGQADSPSAGLGSKGVSLRPAAADGDDAAVSARVTLLPQRDQGPDMRSKVDAPRPPQLQVENRAAARRPVSFDTASAAVAGPADR